MKYNKHTTHKRPFLPLPYVIPTYFVYMSTDNPMHDLSFGSQVGLCTDEDYRIFATPRPGAAAGGGSSSASTSSSASGSSSISQSSIASISIATDSSSPSLRKVVLDWEKEGMSWNADGSLVYKPEEGTTNS